MRRHFADDLGLMVVALETAIGREAIAEQSRASFNGAGDEGTDAGRGEVGKRREADAARMAFWREFDGSDEMQFADGAAALTASDGIALRAIRDIAFVDLDEVFESERSGSTMARRSFCSMSQAVLWEPRPNCAWSCSAEMPLEWLATA
jgi:hypothetical protein